MTTQPTLAGQSLLKGLPPVHPGAILREDVLPAIQPSKAAVARMLGVSRQTLYDILNEKQPVTAPMALRLGKLFGNGAGFWLRLQVNFDLRSAEAALAEDLAAIETLPSAA